jgi:hypothetical protein
VTLKFFSVFLSGLLIGAGLGIALTKMPSQASLLDGIKGVKKGTEPDSDIKVSPVKTSEQRKSHELSCYLTPDLRKNTPLFILGGRGWTFADLPLKEQARLGRLAEEATLRQNQLIEELALRLSLAPRPEDTIPDLSDLAEEAHQISDAEVAAFYNVNKSSFGKNISLEKIKPTIVGHLRSQKILRWVEEKKAELREKGAFSQNYSLSCAPPLNLPIDSFPSLTTPEDAPIRTVFITHPFSPSSRISWPKVDFLRKNKKGILQVKPIPFVAKDAPEIDLILAKSQYCAGQEGPDRLAAWLDVVHRVPIELRGDQRNLFDWIKGKASSEAQLNTTVFASCLTSQDAQKFAESARGLNAGLGLDQAPAVFVNNRRIISSEGDLRGILENLADSYQSM